MPLAEWSGKAAVENKQDIRMSFEIRQADCISAEVLQGEIWSRCVDHYFRHVKPLMFFQLKIGYPDDCI